MTKQEKYLKEYAISPEKDLSLEELAKEAAETGKKIEAGIYIGKDGPKRIFVVAE